MQEYRHQLSHPEDGNMCSFRDGGFQEYTSQMTSFNLYKQTKDQAYKKEQHEEGIQSKNNISNLKGIFSFKKLL